MWISRGKGISSRFGKAKKKLDMCPKYTDAPPPIFLCPYGTTGQAPQGIFH